MIWNFLWHDKKRWPLITGDCLIEVTTWACLIVVKYQKKVVTKSKPIKCEISFSLLHTKLGTLSLKKWHIFCRQCFVEFLSVVQVLSTLLTSLTHPIVLLEKELKKKTYYSVYLSIADCKSFLYNALIATWTGSKSFSQISPEIIIIFFYYIYITQVNAT